MKLFSRSSISSLLVYGLLLGLCSTLISCEREEYPMAKIEAPKNAPEYTYEPDINKSPSAPAQPITVQ